MSKLSDEILKPFHVLGFEYFPSRTRQYVGTRYLSDNSESNEVVLVKLEGKTFSIVGEGVPFQC